MIVGSVPTICKSSTSVIGLRETPFLKYIVQKISILFFSRLRFEVDVDVSAVMLRSVFHRRECGDGKE
jgi:hypothetical protein